MRSTILVLFLILYNYSTILAQNKNSTNKTIDISYHITMMQSPFPMLKVEMAFIGDEGGISEIDIPDHWASQSKLNRGIKNLKVETKGATISSTESRNIKNINHLPSEKSL